MPRPAITPVLRPLSQVAAELNLTPDRLRDHVKAGRIGCHRVGKLGWIYFSAADVDAFLESMRSPAGVGAAQQGEHGGDTHAA